MIVLGYFADEKVFTAWNPFMMRERFNMRQTISLYSRFSIQKKASASNVSVYRDNNNQSIISFKPKYLGLYLENLNVVHSIADDELYKLISKSDLLDIQNEDGELKIDENQFIITVSIGI